MMTKDRYRHAWVVPWVGLRKRAILLAPLLVLFAFVTLPEKRAEATDVATPVEGETMDVQPTGTLVVSDETLYSNSQALKFTDSTVTATENVNFTTSGDVVLMARAGRTGGSPTLGVSVNGTLTAPAQTITNTGAPEPYTFDVNAPPGNVTIGVQAGNTGTGRNPFVDVMSFPANDSNGDVTPPETSIAAGPAEGSADTDGSVAFEFASSESGSSFQCQLVGVEDAFSSCVSPKTYDGLADRSYEFRVKATDAAGNVDPTYATRSFSVAATQAWNCSGVQIEPGADIDAVINADSAASQTRFCVHAGTYNVSAVIRLKVGDKVDAEPGTSVPVGPATKPTPVVKLVGTNGAENLFSPIGNGISITWVDLSGAAGAGPGVGSAIAAGSAGSDFLVQYVRIHNNDSLGISSMNGRVLDSEFFSNTDDPAALGFNASAMKGVDEYEVGRVFVHDEQGNGIWCDVGCENDPARANGFWVHDSVVVNNARAGIRYENSPTQALFEDNAVHGNSFEARRGGISIRDSQNATVRSNTFGAATIGGVSYPNNDRNVAVISSDSGKASRIDLQNVEVRNNTLNGEEVKGCELPDNIVACSGNN